MTIIRKQTTRHFLVGTLIFCLDAILAALYQGFFFTSTQMTVRWLFFVIDQSVLSALLLSFYSQNGHELYRQLHNYPTD